MANEVVMVNVEFAGTEALTPGFRAGFDDDSWIPKQVRSLPQPAADALIKAYPALFKLTQKAVGIPESNKAAAAPAQNK